MARPNNMNCPREGRLLDHDFGATLVMGRDSSGRDVVLAGQKSGMLWALDPDTGKVRWSREFGKGSPIGGIHWGLATDGERVFTPIHAFPGADGVDPNQTPGLHAVSIDDGTVQWSFIAKPDCEGDRLKRVPTCKGNIGLSGAPTVIDGAVVEGSIDGFLRAFDAKTGAMLWSFDTAIPWQGVNGVAGHGGAHRQCLHRRGERLPVRELGLWPDGRAAARQCVRGVPAQVDAALRRVPARSQSAERQDARARALFRGRRVHRGEDAAVQRQRRVRDTFDRARRLEKRAEKAMQSGLGRSFAVTIRSSEFLRALLDADPFRAFDLPANAKRVITFLQAPPAVQPALPIERDGARILAVAGTEVFSAYVSGDNGPVFMTLLERTFGKDITTRTLDTVRKCAQGAELRHARQR